MILISLSLCVCVCVCSFSLLSHYMRSKNRNFICIEELCLLQIISFHKIYQQILKSLIEDGISTQVRGWRKQTKNARNAAVAGL